ncbi:MAG: hypothetical protein A2901_06320 [Elusimicrobia bacterium RIFCSPLOWO2_01_FULL_54_10]|nr:MAG: hypothetical protein A2901_06320 [Elusimicrobia bacterium RIFCSPLOWO2_01_FULL_54_10]
MDRIELLEEKIDSVSRLVSTLREKNGRMERDCERLQQENELLSSENKMVRKLMSELDRLRDERKLIRGKCEKLVLQYEKLKI